ncbi:MAG: GNAT family N-acetyltransferase [Eubacteriaceae bacterium]|nr:GNAT family N-acetyltransferase [Eubacteriaceae bacterium]
MVLETERLIMRKWRESDAKDLFLYAKDPAVGPIAGWPPHRSEEESLDIIRNVLNGAEAYAVCLKEDGRAIGAIELRLCGHTDMTDREDECELGYWLGKPFWGQGIMPEAAGEILRHAFEDLGMTKVWAGYYDGNERSKRVQEKLGLRYQWTTHDVEVPRMNEVRVGHVNCITREEWARAAGRFIAFCGLDCEKCDARIATERNDDEMRASVAKLWSELNHADITPEMINCTGCRVPGAKTPYCGSICPIRQCALEKGLSTCAGCCEMKDCGKLSALTQNSPEALENLRGRK